MDRRSQVAPHLEPWRSLGHKVVLVTGASSGLGREFCLDLAIAGCRIVAAARRIHLLESLCHEINRTGSVEPNSGLPTRAVAVELDVSATGTAIDAAVQRAWDAFGRIDVLINNAGIRGRVHSTLDATEEEWDNLIRTNLTGTWLVTKSVCLRMCNAKQGGSVINISSTAGLNRTLLPGNLAYGCSKAAVNTMTQVMALELGKHQIRVNSISPGIFKSEITEKLLERDWLKNVVLRTVPLRTFGTSDPALTSLVRYLIHDSSQYVTGNCYIVAAGATLPGVPIFSSL
ncbi:unnamed protein product [Cuscuta campestris]|uniref:3-oxoacyl-[acyl-carrier-protein] reductase n=1 Tax=Cuscuta campestris TaxID=132261 RepID=A0A484MQC5_9ASTE|nr:unnamed protein product [Cuscuta campestris]